MKRPYVFQSLVGTVNLKMLISRGSDRKGYYEQGAACDRVECLQVEH